MPYFAHSSTRVAPLTPVRSAFSIEVVPYLKTDLPPAKKQAYQARLFGEHLTHYLDCVVRGVDHWVTTGRAVVEDQFGWNPLYSAPAASAR